MKTLKTLFSALVILGAVAAPALAQTALSPNGTFVDKWGTTFTFSLCGGGTDLCGKLDVLKGDSATAQNLAYVGTQVMQAKASGANTWKGSINAGGMSGQVTAKQTGANRINITGCKAVVLCNTITYTRR